MEVALSLKCRSAYQIESSFIIFLAEIARLPEDSNAKGANSNEVSEGILKKGTIFLSSVRSAATPAVSAAAGSKDDCRGEAIVTSITNGRSVDQFGI